MNSESAEPYQYARKKSAQVPGGGCEDTCDHGLSRRSLREMALMS